MPRRTSVKVVARETPKQLAPGWSPLAIRSQTYTKNLRPKGWRGKIYGLVVHTTGRGLPSKARKLKEYPTKTAIDYYNQSHGCHYIIGYRGREGGDLIQVANEDVQANGVGFGDQRKAGWKGIPESLRKRWEERWPGYARPRDLLPGTQTVNSAYVHVECIPLTKEHFGVFLDGHGLFTDAQYDTIAELAIDVARRNGWPEEWWRTPRLVGHEDLTPLTRHDKRGGWDPGYLRSKRYFEWDLVIDTITARMSQTTGTYDYEKEPNPNQ